MKKNMFIIIFRIFQLLCLIPSTLLIYLGSRKMGVMRYNYFIDREISEKILTKENLNLFVIIFILSIIIFFFKTFKLKSTMYVLGLILSVISILLIKFNLFYNTITPIPHVVILSIIIIFVIELAVIMLKNKIKKYKICAGKHVYVL